MSQEAFRQIGWRVDDPADEWADVAIYIDGVPLIDLVKKYEESRGYYPAGSYGWSPLRWTPLHSRHFSGAPHWPTNGAKALLLVCACQNLGCWDFNGRIVIKPGHVEWTDFEQVHRMPDSPGGHWDYGGFGPFRFHRHQYETALAAVRPATSPADALDRAGG